MEKRFSIPVATWLREKEVPIFAGAFSATPNIHLRDARIESVSLETCRGLLLTGGSDISVDFLAQENIDESQIREPDPARDAWEFATVREAYQRRMPILAICRGVQVLNVALGGTLHLHVEGHDRHKDANGQPLHYSTLGTPFRFEKVNSHHHQALDRVAAPLVVEAVHAPDNVIEQVRIRDYPWGWGVQYHPERDSVLYASLFTSFAEACRENCGD